MNGSRVAVVTASSRGIGAAVARRLSQDGWSLVLMSRSDGIHEVAQEVGGLSLRGDVTKQADLEALVNLAVTERGRIDAVVNNTGHPSGDDLLGLSDEQWLRSFETLLLNVIRMARIVTPYFQTQRSGVIVNISASDAYEPDPQFPMTSTLRAALGSYTKLYARRFGHDGIRMNCVCPSVAYDYDPENIPPDILENVPLQRPATYIEVANVVAFLLSDEASYMTGQNVIVDGGRSRRCS